MADCGKLNHTAAECRQKARDQQVPLGKGKGKGKEKGKGPEKGRGRDERHGQAQAHAVEVQEPVEAQLLEREENLCVMAVARGLDVEMKCSDATKRVRCMKQWIIDSGAQTRVVRLISRGGAFPWNLETKLRY